MPSRPEIKIALEALDKEDGVIVVPTDTSYRLLCRLDRPRAIERLYSLELRDRSSSLVILGSDPQSLIDWITDDLTRPILLANEFWPGLLTVVARASDRVPAAILGPGFKYELTVALRMPNHKVALALLSLLPDYSAATAGLHLPETVTNPQFSDIQQLLGDSVDYILPDLGQHPGWWHSTVVDVSDNDEARVLRQGEISEERVLACLNAFENP